MKCEMCKKREGVSVSETKVSFPLYPHPNVLCRKCFCDTADILFQLSENPENMRVIVDNAIKRGAFQ